MGVNVDGDADALFDMVCRVRLAAGAAWAWVNIVDADGIITILGDGPGHDRLTGRRYPATDSLTMRLAKSGQDVISVADTFETYTGWQRRAWIIRAGLGPCVLALLRDHDRRVIGSIVVGQHTGAPPFGPHVEPLLLAAAREAEQYFT